MTRVGESFVFRRTTTDAGRQAGRQAHARTQDVGGDGEAAVLLLPDQRGELVLGADDEEHVDGDAEDGEGVPDEGAEDGAERREDLFGWLLDLIWLGLVSGK